MEKVPISYTPQKFKITTFMLSLNSGNSLKCRRYSPKALIIGNLRKIAVQDIPLLAFTLSGSQQILARRAYSTRRIRSEYLHTATFEKLKETLGMFSLLLGCLKKNPCHLLIALFLGY